MTTSAESTQQPVERCPLSQEACPVCEAGTSSFHAKIDGYTYLRCDHCGSLHLATKVLNAIDAGHSTRVYDATYWADELRAARQRASGASVVRAGEAILYARRPVRRFLDVGTGPGFLLDELSRHFPAYSTIFHGVELFPPAEHSAHPNYLVGGAGDLPGRFDAGVCIEVVEHLTPRMLAKLAQDLAGISEPGSLWLFNTGMPELVLGRDPGYLDPLRRGHIVSYGLMGVEHLFAPHGFRVSAIPGKDYAWLAEYGDERGATMLSFEDRVYHPIPENSALLETSGLVYQAAFESARASLYSDQMMQRTRWALGMETELHTARDLYAALQVEHDGVARWAHELRDQLDGLRNQLDALRAGHARVLNSRSWKVTQPLRAIWALVSRRHA